MGFDKTTDPAHPTCIRPGRPNPNGAASALYLVGHSAEGRPAGCLAALPTERAAARTLTVLHFNDLHGRLIRPTAHGDQPVFARLAGEIGRIRGAVAAAPRRALLLLAAGDDLGGSPFDELLAPARLAGATYDDCPTSGDLGAWVHAPYRAYTAAGVDAAVLGNHDFDLGMEVPAAAIRRDAGFPVLCANLRPGTALDGLCPPAVILVTGGLRVGVIGVTTPAPVREGRTLRPLLTDPVQAVLNLLPRLRPLCHVVVVLSHLGRSLDATTATVRRAGDVELARALPPGGVHLIVGGHTHHPLNEGGLELPNLVNGIPIVQAGAMGRYLGQVEMQVNGRPGDPVAVTDVRLLESADFPVDDAFQARVVTPLLAATRPLMERTLGKAAEDPALGSDAVRNGFAAGESPLANFVTDGLVARCRAAGLAVDLALIDGTCIRSGLPGRSRLTFADWFQVMPYADTIRICSLSGRALLALLQENARRVDRPGEPHMERGFLHVSSRLRYTIDLGADRFAARVRDAHVDGLPLEDNLTRIFTVASTNFVHDKAQPWDTFMETAGFPATVRLREVEWQDTGLFVRRELVAQIETHGGVTVAAGARRDGRLQILAPGAGRPCPAQPAHPAASPLAPALVASINLWKETPNA